MPPLQLFDVVDKKRCLQALSLMNQRNSFKKKFLSGWIQEDGASMKGTKERLDQIQSYLHKLSISNFELPVTYSPSKNDKNGEGRLYAGKEISLQFLPRDLRNFLIADKMVDIDIVNAEPSIWRFLCDRLNISSPYLNEYCKERERILSENGLKKQDIIVAMNRDTNYDRKNTWWRHFTKELLDIKRDIVKKEKLVPPEGRNPLSRAIYPLVRKYERILVDRAMTPYKENNSLRVPMFDGFLVEKSGYSGIQQVNSSVPVEMREFVKFIEKPIVAPEVPEEAEQSSISEAGVLPTYDEAKEDFEKNFFRVDNPLGLYYETDGAIQRISNQDINIHTSHIKIRSFDELSSKWKVVPITKSWLEDPNKRKYKGFIYEPTSQEEVVHTQYYNLAKPFHIYSDRKVNCNADISNFKSLLGNLCGDREEEITFLTRLLGRKVFSPNENLQTLGIFFGTNGTGKDTLFKILMKILGDSRVVSLDKLDGLFGNDNASLVQDADIININEVGTAKTKEYMDSIKDFITTKQVVLSQKFEKTKTVKNTKMLFYSTNNVVRLEAKDRRAMVFNSGDRLVASIHPDIKEFWNKMYADMEDPEWLNTVFDYLMDIGKSAIADNWLPSQNIVASEIMNDWKDSSIPVELQFLHHLVSTIDPELCDSEEERTSARMFRQYYCKGHGRIKSKNLEEIWGIYFNHLKNSGHFPYFRKLKSTVNNACLVMKYKPHKENGKQVGYYYFDPKEISKQLIEKKLVDIF